jgi:hypothetical protein
VTPVRYHGFRIAEPISDPVKIYSGLPTPDRVLADIICLLHYDCLYYQDGPRAPEICIRRGSNLNIESVGPARIEVPAVILRYENPLIYLGTFAWNFSGHILTEGISRVWYLRHCQ